MRKFVVIAIVVAVVGGAAAYFGVFSRERRCRRGGTAGRRRRAAAAQARARRRGAQGGGGGGGFGGGGFGGPGGGGGGPRVPMTVELGTAKRGDVAAHLTVVGNLIGLQTVDVAPRTGGRLAERQRAARRSRAPRPGARQGRGSRNRRAGPPGRSVAGSVEGHHPPARSRPQGREAQLRSLEESVRSGSCSPSRRSTTPSRATWRRSRSSICRRRSCSQNDARLAGAAASTCRTPSVTSPVDGFVGKRNVDPGAMVNTNTAIASVVDISRLRLVVNVVEKDLRMVSAGDAAIVEVDAYPGEKFNGQIARVAPVLDPATRTAPMEVEIPNADYKLKPGMYARINLTVEERKNVLVVPKNAVVDFENKRGVWVPNEEQPRAVRAGEARHRRHRPRRDSRGPEGRRQVRDDRRRRGAQQRPAAHRRRRRAAVRRRRPRRPRRPGSRRPGRSTARASPRGQRPAGPAARGGQPRKRPPAAVSDC